VKRERRRREGAGEREVREEGNESVCAYM